MVPWKKGFHPMCWNANGINQLYKENFNDIPDYNRSEIYSVHLYNNKAKNLIPKTLHNFDWIQTSTSLVGQTDLTYYFMMLGCCTIYLTL